MRDGMYVADVGKNAYKPKWELTVCGSLLKLKRNTDRERRRGRRKRSTISDFSPKSRFRLLKNIATIDWRSVRCALLVTVTYPDGVVHWDKDKRNRERYLFARNIENHLERPVPAIWRVEYKPRLTGNLKGTWCPHIHLLLFGVQFIDQALLRQWWKEAIGWEGKVVIDVRRAAAGKVASLYVAKYCGKVDSSLSLDKVPYLNNAGRHYGYLRSTAIPRHLPVTVPVLDADLVHYIRVKAGLVLRYLDLRYEESFTLLGDVARKLGDEVLGKLLR